MTRMARQNLPRNAPSQSHAGLWLDRYLPLWPDEATAKGEAFTDHIARACQLKPPAVYAPAYRRWRGHVAEQVARGEAAAWVGRVDGRLFLGLGGASPMEAAIDLHHTYGVPRLPGSALKGLARAYAAAAGLGAELAEVLFGRAPSGEGEEWDGGDGGYLVFHDAWWVPQGAALSPEVVTVHHPDYYAQKDEATATDFDSPTPNAQIAVQGSFLFAVEGLEGWGREGLAWLKLALQAWGAGAKTAGGYGYFNEDGGEQKKLDADVQKARQQGLSGEALLREKIQALKDKDLAEAVGKKWTATREDWARLCPGISDRALHGILAEFHGGTLSAWETADKNTNFHKACKRWKSLGQDH